MDVTWILVIVVLIGVGIWTKWRNTLHMRKLAADIKSKDEQSKPPTSTVVQDDAHDSLGVAEMGIEIMGQDNPPQGGQSV